MKGSKRRVGGPGWRRQIVGPVCASSAAMAADDDDVLNGVEWSMMNRFVRKNMVLALQRLLPTCREGASF